MSATQSTETATNIERYRMPSGRIARLNLSDPPAAVEDARQMLIDNGAVPVEDGVRQMHPIEEKRTEAALVRSFVQEVRHLRDNTTPVISPDDPRVQVLVEARPNLMRDAESLIAESEHFQQAMGELYTEIQVSRLTSPLVAPAWAEYTSIEAATPDEITVRFSRRFGETAELTQTATILIGDLVEDGQRLPEGMVIWEQHPNLYAVALDSSVEITASTAKDIANTFIDVFDVLADAERDDPPMTASAVMGARNLIKAMRETGAKNLGELYAMQQEATK